MILKRGDEIVEFPLNAFENISNPTLEVMLGLGFIEYTPEEMTIEQKKATLLMEQKMAVTQALSVTDYQVIKSVEISGYQISSDILATRTDLRLRWNNYEAAVIAAKTIDELNGIIF